MEARALDLAELALALDAANQLGYTKAVASAAPTRFTNAPSILKVKLRGLCMLLNRLPIPDAVCMAAPGIRQANNEMHDLMGEVFIVSALWPHLLPFQSPQPSP